MKAKQPSVLVLVSDETQQNTICRTLRESSRTPDVVRAAMLSEALRILNNNEFDVFVCDQALLNLQTSQTFRILLSRYPGTHLVFLASDSVERGPACLERHDRVYFVEGAENVMGAVHGLGVCRERRAQVRRERTELAGPRPEAPKADLVELKRLTPRQNEIMQGLSRGLSNKEIARKLGIQETTVKVQLKLIYRALQVSNRTQAAVLLARKQEPADRRTPLPKPASWQGDGMRNFNVFFPSGAWPTFQYGHTPTK